MKGAKTLWMSVLVVLLLAAGLYAGGGRDVPA